MKKTIKLNLQISWVNLILKITDQDLLYYFNYQPKDKFELYLELLKAWFNKERNFYYRSLSITMRPKPEWINEFVAYLRFHGFHFQNKKVINNLYFITAVIKIDFIHNAFTKIHPGDKFLFKRGTSFENPGRPAEGRTRCFRHWVLKLLNPIMQIPEIKNEDQAFDLIGMLFNYITSQFREEYKEKLKEKPIAFDVKKFRQSLSGKIRTYRNKHPKVKVEKLSELVAVMKKIINGDQVLINELSTYMRKGIGIETCETGDEPLNSRQVKFFILRHTHNKPELLGLNAWPSEYQPKKGDPIIKEFRLMKEKERRMRKEKKEMAKTLKSMA